MILLTTLISHSLLATNPLCITTCYTNFMPLVYHEGIWSAANSIFAYYLHFKLNTQITGAALNQIYPSSWPQRVVQPGESGCGNPLICFFISLKDMVSSFWENRNKTAKLHCIIPLHWFLLLHLRLFIRSLTVVALLYSWNWIRVSWLTPIN